MRFQSTPFSAVIQNNGMRIFTFGSNASGRHGKGAALIASRYWGAIKGVAEGPTGFAYAIPTKNENLNTLPLGLIQTRVIEFMDYADDNPELTFLVTRIGCGLDGYRDEQIAPMFRGAPDNCVFQSEWEPYLK
jgi:hypothetical protein